MKFKSCLRVCHLFILSISTLLVSGQAGEWVDLFDGKTLDGWSIKSGTCTYHVEDGAIVGTTVLGSPNTFLCTDRTYSDFVLEFEVMCDPELNSGVQFRSIAPEGETVFIFRNNEGDVSKRENHAGRLYGYQVEIARQSGGAAGGVYDEARRAFFLDRPEPGSDASKAFKDDGWNQYRVEAIGNHIVTYVNGQKCADFYDDMTYEGIIGLQVHSIRAETNPEYQVRWKNIRLMEK